MVKELEIKKINFEKLVDILNTKVDDVVFLENNESVEGKIKEIKDILIELQVNERILKERLDNLKLILNVDLTKYISLETFENFKDKIVSDLTENTDNCLNNKQSIEANKNDILSLKERLESINNDLETIKADNGLDVVNEKINLINEDIKLKANIDDFNALLMKVNEKEQVLADLEAKINNSKNELEILKNGIDEKLSLIEQKLNSFNDYKEKNNLDINNINNKINDLISQNNTFNKNQINELLNNKIDKDDFSTIVKAIEVLNGKVDGILSPKNNEVSAVPVVNEVDGDSVDSAVSGVSGEKVVPEVSDPQE